MHVIDYFYTSGYLKYPMNQSSKYLNKNNNVLEVYRKICQSFFSPGCVKSDWPVETAAETENRWVWRRRRTHIWCPTNDQQC